jgi:hypothetical protein
MVRRLNGVEWLTEMVYGLNGSPAAPTPYTLSQFLLSLGARIVDDRLEGRLLLFDDTRGGVLAFAIRPVLPLLLEAMDGGNVVLAQQRDVQGFGQGQEFVVHGGFGFGIPDLLTYPCSGDPERRCSGDDRGA